MLETGPHGTGAYRQLALGVLMALLSLSAPGLIHAQGVRGVEVEARPSPIPLGRLMELEIRVRTEAGWGLEAPDSIGGLRDFRQSGLVRVTRSVPDSGQVSWNITYPLIPLRAGFRPLPALTLSLHETERGDGGVAGPGQPLRVPLNGISVQSVLPPPDQAVSPAPPRFPTKPEQAGTSFLLWAALGALGTGFGWYSLRNKAGREVREQWGGNDDGSEDGEAPPLADQLCRVLQLEAATDTEREEVFDRSVLLVRQILESRSPKSLTAHTTPELIDYLRNGSGLLNADTLEKALVAAEHVRFRKGPPSEQELVDFQEGIWAWLELEDPEVGRKRAERRHV